MVAAIGSSCSSSRVFTALDLWSARTDGGVEDPKGMRRGSFLPKGTTLAGESLLAASKSKADSMYSSKGTSFAGESSQAATKSNISSMAKSVAKSVAESVAESIAAEMWG